MPVVILDDASITDFGVAENALQMRKGHSTLALTRDLLRFLRFCSPSTSPRPFFTRRQVMSCALGAAW